MTEVQHFDIIVVGGGLSGLTAVTEMLQHTVFGDLSYLILDKHAKNQNDRTWCFWESPDEYALTPVRSRTWRHFTFQSSRTGLLKLNTASYRYTMLRSSLFYQWAYDELDHHPRVVRKHEYVRHIDADQGCVYTDEGIYQAKWILNSAFLTHQIVPKTVSPKVGWEQVFAVGDHITTPQDEGVSYLQQHFLGWFIRTETDQFRPDELMLMDYRTPHTGDTRFVYVLPMSAREALVEYTIFSNQLLTDRSDYEAAIRQYLADQLQIHAYEVVETEFGVIPMSDFRPPKQPQGKVLHIGTQGGTIKASSGYGFKSTRKRMRAWVRDWATKGQPDMRILQSDWRFRVYDSILLGVLQHQYTTGDAVFSSMFKRLPAYHIFRFLDEQTHFLEDIRMMLSVPTWPFIRGLAAKWRTLLR